MLAGEVDDLARLAAALPEAAVVEDQGGDAVGGEPLGIGDQAVHVPLKPWARTTHGSRWSVPACGSGRNR